MNSVGPMRFFRTTDTTDTTDTTIWKPGLSGKFNSVGAFLISGSLYGEKENNSNLKNVGLRIRGNVRDVLLVSSHPIW